MKTNHKDYIAEAESGARLLAAVVFGLPISIIIIVATIRWLF